MTLHQSKTIFPLVMLFFLFFIFESNNHPTPGHGRSFTILWTGWCGVGGLGGLGGLALIQAVSRQAGRQWPGTWPKHAFLHNTWPAWREWLDQDLQYRAWSKCTVQYSVNTVLGLSDLTGLCPIAYVGLFSVCLYASKLYRPHWACMHNECMWCDTLFIGRNIFPDSKVFRDQKMAWSLKQIFSSRESNM